MLSMFVAEKAKPKEEPALTLGSPFSPKSKNYASLPKE